MSELRVRAVVLAGGFGTRIQHLLPDRPKPMALVAGRPFLEWVLLFLQRGGVHDFCLSTGFRAAVVADHFAREPLSGARIRCVPETTPLGTGGGFLNCTMATTPPELWLVTNGDSLAMAPIGDLLALLNDPAVDGAVLGLEMSDASRYGTLQTGLDGRLTGFAEKQPGHGVINAGVYVFRHRLLARFPTHLPLSLETDVFPQLLGAARIKVLATVAPFLDIGTPERLAQAEDFISQHLSHFSP